MVLYTYNGGVIAVMVNCMKMQSANQVLIQYFAVFILHFHAFGKYMNPYHCSTHPTTQSKIAEQTEI